MKSSSLFAAIAALSLLGGCASLPPERGYAETSALLQQRRGVSPDASGWSAPAPVPSLDAPLDLDTAVAFAFVHNPYIRERYAQLGLARAELEQARRLANPRFGYARLHGDEAHPKITRSVSLGFAELLLLPARKRFADAELQRVQDSVAADLLTLAADVEAAWYTAVGARQVADLRALVVQASEASATLAQRFFDAGNIDALQLEQERAQASGARIDAAHATARWFEARSELAALTGLSAQEPWIVPARLASPSSRIPDSSSLMSLALVNRLDLAAAQRAVALREDALGVTRRWRWLGSVEAGFEREREGGDGVSQGPSLSFELPLFGQGQAAIGRGESELLAARARLDTLTLSVQNDTRLAVQRVNVAREIAQEYRSVLVPAREAIVARQQERVNYMLVGAFELLRARREEFDAYQAYLESVRDYWVARAQLREVVGGRLPDDGETAAPTLGVDAMLPSPAAASDHSAPGAHSPATQTPSQNDAPIDAHQHHHHNDTDTVPADGGPR